MDGVLNAIYRETNLEIRRSVLEEYLNTIPAGQLGKAFEKCIDLEGVNQPEGLVVFFLPIWAKREPNACWKRTKELFHVVIENDWLMYDSWEGSPRITPQDLTAIRKSRFWLEQRALASFPIGINRADLPKRERVRILKEFSEKWLNAFGSWPETWPETRGSISRNNRVVLMREAFDRSVDRLPDWFPSNPRPDEQAFEICARRWLKSSPGAALEIIKKCQEKKWPPYDGQSEMRPGGPSAELLLIWAKVDLPAMIQWAESLDLKDELTIRAKGLLMSRVNAEVRERWLAEAKSADPNGDRWQVLVAGWARWDPKPALQLAISTGNFELIDWASNAAVYGPFSDCPDNTTHSGLGVLREVPLFDKSKVFDPELLKGHSWETLMEQWGEVDIGEAARYGYDFLTRYNFAPREKLASFFSGHDEYPDTGDMIDRTFCALRVWAVIRPTEMKSWIATLDDPKMQKALTWMLQHPWGT